VPLNNELAAARGEAAAAEENVMWQLTGQIIDNLADMQAALAIVSARPDASRACCNAAAAAAVGLYPVTIKAGLDPEKAMRQFVHHLT